MPFFYFNLFVRFFFSNSISNNLAESSKSVPVYCLNAASIYPFTCSLPLSYSLLHKCYHQGVFSNPKILRLNMPKIRY